MVEAHNSKLKTFTRWTTIFILLFLFLSWLESSCDISKLYKLGQKNQFSKVEASKNEVENINSLNTDEVFEKPLVQIEHQVIVEQSVVMQDIEQQEPVVKRERLTEYVLETEPEIAYAPVVVSYIPQGSKKAYTPEEMVSTHPEIIRENIETPESFDYDLRDKSIVIEAENEKLTEMAEVGQVNIEKDTEKLPDELLETGMFSTLANEYFKDIPFLTGIEINTDKTKVIVDSDMAHNIGVLEAVLPYTLKGVYDFYLNKMNMWGWELVSHGTSSEAVIVYKKQHRRATFFFTGAGADGTKMRLEVVEE